MQRIHKVLIANRGEIACRIARTCRRLGLKVATVHSSVDRHARHVREIGESVELGGAAPSDSYLRIDAIVAAALRVGADAVHPGFGFVSENPDFVRALDAARLIFIGPTAETMERLGGKAQAKREAARLGVPVIAGSEGGMNAAAEVVNAVRGMPLPVLLKAVAGGGGRGMAVVDTLDGLDARVESAMREAEKAFGNGELIVERYLPRVRHIEVQVAGDGQGHAIHLFERECTLQRRHQKVIEEAPSAGLPPALRERLLADAVKLAAGVNYRGLGTVEFVVAGDEHHFLEVNPRLQVEHPVTEEVTGLDLVELQLRIADTSRLPLAQADVRCEGHAFEARLCAEDAEAGFLPTTGRLDRIDFSRAAVRIESGVESGDEISPYYDSMIAKLVSRGPNREAARRALAAGLRDSTVIGLTTNLQFLHELLHWPQTIAATFHTRLIDESFAADAAAARPAPVVPAEHVAAAALQWLAAQRAATPELGCWSQAQGFTGWRLANGGAALRRAAGRRQPRADARRCARARVAGRVAQWPPAAALRRPHARTRARRQCPEHRAVEPARAQRVRLHALPRRCARRRRRGWPARRADDGQGGGAQGRGRRCGEDRPDGDRARVDEDGAARHRPVRRQRGRCALQGRRHGRAAPGAGRGGAARIV
jgi:3-methylcrotonyl-CoA carboxylase alpha subunit